MLHYSAIRFLIRVFQKQLKLVLLILPSGKGSYKSQRPNSLSFDFPPIIKHLRIDVGLSDDASHSVECLMDHDDRAIIGVEPHPDNITLLKRGTAKFHSISLNGGYIRKGHNIRRIPNITSLFCLIQGAAGNVKNIKKRTFFSAFPDRGNSSFYNTQSLEASGNTVDKVFEVDEFPLSKILSSIDFKRFPFIESLKIDTEGHDLDVLKGCGKYLSKVLYCRVECFKGDYPQTRYLDKAKMPSYAISDGKGFFDTATAVVDFLEDKNFVLISSKPGDYVFLNKKLSRHLLNYEVYPG